METVLSQIDPPAPWPVKMEAKGQERDQQMTGANGWERALNKMAAFIRRITGNDKRDTDN